MSFDEVKTAVLALPPQEQEQIAAILEEQWSASLLSDEGVKRRVLAEAAAADRDGDAGVPWQVVRDEMRNDLDAIQRSREAARASSAT